MDRYDLMHQALVEYRALSAAMSAYADDFGYIVARNLRQCKPHDLARMKRELAKFNLRTNKWETP